MNEFYHEMEYGFNAWYVVMPAFVVFFAILGSVRYFLDRENRITKRDNRYDWFVKILAAVLDLVVMVLIVRESILGIFQYFANRLDLYESPKYVFWLAVVMLTIVGVFYYYLLVGVANVAGWTKLGFLLEKCREIKEEERMAKQERTKKELHQQLRQIHPRQHQEQVVLKPQEYQRILERLDQMEAEIRQNFGLPQKAV